MRPPVAHRAQLVELTKCIKVFGSESAWEEAFQELISAQRRMLEVNTIHINSVIGACARAEEWQQALCMLSQMAESHLEPDVISYTLAMTSCKRQQRWPEAILLVGDAADSSTPIDQSLCTTTVSICSKAAWERALVVFHIASRHGIRAHHSMHNSLLVPSGDGRWERCVTQLTTMQQLDIERSPMSFGSLISCCGNCGHWTGSVAFLQKMHEDLGLSLPACTSAVIACVREREGGRALRLLDQMVVSQILPTLVTYGGALVAAREDWSTALALFAHLRHRHELVPDAACYVATITACARGQQWATCLDFLSEALDRSAEMGDAAYGTILGALEQGSSGSFRDHFKELIRFMRSRQVEVNTISFSTAISVAHRSGRWYRALGLYEELWNLAMEADALTVSSSISAAGAGFFWTSAMELLERAARQHLEQEFRQTNACIAALGRGQWQLSLEMLHVEDANEVSYNSALAALERGQQWLLAMSEIAELQVRSLQMDIYTCSTAISACNDVWPEALQWLQLSQTQLLETSNVVLNAATSACSKGDEWQQAFLSLEQVQGLVDIDPGDSTPGFNSALQACIRCSQWQTALTLWCNFQLQEPRSVNIYSWLLMECEQRSVAGEEEVLEELRSTWLWAHGDGLVVPLPATPRFPGQWQAKVKEATWNDFARRPGFGMPAALAGAASGAGTMTAPYNKELRLLLHVLQTAEAGNSTAVCNSIETFGSGVLGNSRSWLKLAGGCKATVLASAARAAPPFSSVLEIGTYCGYSSLRLAMAVPGVQVVTVDVDPAHVLIARNVIAFAGFEPPEIALWTGHSSTLLPRLCQKVRERAFGMVFMDQRGSLYHEDLQCLESSGVLRKGAVVVADNVLKPGAPLLLWRFAFGQKYHAQQLSMQEFAMPVEDWMALAVVKDMTPAKEVQPESPELLKLLWELHDLSDEIRTRALLPGRGMDFFEWRQFAARMKAGLQKLGITSVSVSSETDR